MKILKAILIILIPSVITVGCRKSDTRPCGGDHVTTVSSNSGSTSENKDNNSTNPDAQNRRVVTENTNSNSAENENTAVIDPPDANGSSLHLVGEENTENPGEVVSSGDDDRDGGDSKKKKK